VASGEIPYSSSGAFLEYPPVSGLILYLARIIGGNYAGYYVAFSAFSILAAALMAWSTWRLARAFGVTINPFYFILPSMVVYGVYNFDLFNALFIVLGLQFFVEKKRGWSALFLGLAVATKFIGGILFPILLMELASWEHRFRYLAIAGLTAAVFFLPIVLFNPGYINQLYAHYSGWGLEDAWFVWIFADTFSRTAKLFGLVLLLMLLARVYTLRMPLAQKSFLTLTAYLLATYIYAPQFNLTLIPLVAVLALSSPAVFFWEVFNALIILTWFTIPTDQTHAWTLPQTMALLRSAALAVMGFSVASSSGHSLLAWLKRVTSADKSVQTQLAS
jgi:hypothetical protein